MIITTFGVLYIIILLVAFQRSYQAVAYIFALSYLFQMTMVFAIGSTGIMPYLLSPFFFFFKFLCLPKYSNVGLENVYIKFILFILFVVIQGFVAKSLFEGDVMVYEGSAMESAIMAGKQPFYFSSRIVIQWIYLILNMIGLFSLLKHAHYLEKKFAGNLVYVSVSLVVILGLWKYFSDNFGGFYPNDFFENNISYDLSNMQQSMYDKFRFSSIFSEASVCGLALSVFFWNTVLMNVKNKFLLLLFIVVSLILTIASTGFLAFAFGVILYVVYTKNYKSFFFILGTFTIILFFVHYFNLDEALWNMTFNKANSDSAENRSTIMISQLQLFIDTLGWGCGLGSSCAAGLFTTLLGHLGLIGLLMFCSWVLEILKYLKSNGTSILAIPLLVLLFGMSTSVGYLSYPVLWFELIIVLTANKNEIVFIENT